MYSGQSSPQNPHVLRYADGCYKTGLGTLARSPALSSAKLYSTAARAQMAADRSGDRTAVALPLSDVQVSVEIRG